MIIVGSASGRLSQGEGTPVIANALGVNPNFGRCYQWQSFWLLEYSVREVVADKNQFSVAVIGRTS
jgi:hypothetical protein